MIKDFADKRTAAIFHGMVIKRLDRSLQEAARLKLTILHHAVKVDDLRLPPSNRLEKLAGDREGQWSFRVNRKWRICFRWTEGDAFDVELVDYH